MKTVKCENNDYRMQNLPYEKFLMRGSKSLTDSELLAIILRTGTRGVSACQLGERVLSQTSRNGNGLLGLHQISLHDLMQHLFLFVRCGCGKKKWQVTAKSAQFGEAHC